MDAFQKDQKGAQTNDKKLAKDPTKRALKKDKVEKSQENLTIEVPSAHSGTSTSIYPSLRSIASKSNEPSVNNFSLNEQISVNSEKQSELSSGARPKYRRQKSNVPIEITDADTVLVIRNNKIVAQTGPHEVKLKGASSDGKKSTYVKGSDTLSTIADYLPDGLFTVKTGRRNLPDVPVTVTKESDIMLPDGTFTFSTTRDVTSDVPVGIQSKTNVLPDGLTIPKHSGTSYAGQLPFLNPFTAHSSFAKPQIDNAFRLGEQFKNLQEDSVLEKTAERRKEGNISRWFFPGAHDHGRLPFGQLYSDPVVGGVFPHNQNLPRDDTGYVSSFSGYFSKNKVNNDEHNIPRAKTTTNQNMFNRIPLYNRFPQFHSKDGMARRNENVPCSNDRGLAGSSHPVSSSMVTSRNASYYTGHPLIKISEDVNSLTVASNELPFQQGEIRKDTTEVGYLPSYGGHPESKVIHSREPYLHSGPPTIENKNALEARHSPVPSSEASRDFRPPLERNRTVQTIHTPTVSLQAAHSSIVSSHAVLSMHNPTVSLQTLQTAYSAIVSSNAKHTPTVSMQTLRSMNPPFISNTSHSMYPQIPNSHAGQSVTFPFTQALQALRPSYMPDLQSVRNPIIPDMQTVQPPNFSDMQTVLPTNRSDMQTVLPPNRPDMQAVRPPIRYFWQAFPPPPIRHPLPDVRPPMSQTLQAERPPKNETLQSERPPMSQTLQAERPPMNQTLQAERPSMSQTLQSEHTPTSQSLQHVHPPPRSNFQAAYPQIVGDNTFRAVHLLLGHPLQAVHPPLNISLHDALRPPINFTLPAVNQTVSHAVQTLRPPPLSNHAMQSVHLPLMNNYAMQPVHPSMINNHALQSFLPPMSHASQTVHSSISNSNAFRTAYPPTASSYPMPAGNPAVTAMSGFPAHIGQSSSGVYSFYSGFPAKGSTSNVSASDQRFVQPGWFVNPVLNTRSNTKKSKANSKKSGQGGPSKPKNVVGVPMHLRKNIRVRFKEQSTTDNPEDENAEVFQQTESSLGDTEERNEEKANQGTDIKKEELSTLSEMSSCSVSWSSYEARNTPSPKKDLDMEYISRLLEKETD